MSDTRYTLVGVVLIFAGFVILGIFGARYYQLGLQAQEFGTCYEYKDGTQIPISCDIAMQDKVLFFILVVGLLAAGIYFLIKGVRGRWDQDVRPEDAVGPSRSFPS